MPGRGTKAVIVLLGAALLSGTASSDENVLIGKMGMDQVSWGARLFHVPVENYRDDTLHLNIILHTLYPGHYLSGMDRLEVDTVIDIPPNAYEDLFVPFEIPGSFGRMATRAMIIPRYDNYQAPPGVNDTALQVFSNVFNARDDATAYAGRKHSVGPVYTVMDHFQLNYEYPRLVLFLLARGKSPSEISDLFRAEMEYTHIVIKRFRREDFFLPAGDSPVPGILAVSEREGYVLKEKANAAIAAFTSWYKEDGKGEMARILKDGGIDPYAAELPSIQIPILLTLLEELWVDAEAGFDVPRFEDMERDIAVCNRTRWIMQGGEFFLPKLCLGVFEQNSQMHLATFSPDAELPFDKACIYDMRRAVEDAGEAIIAVDAEQVRRALGRAREDEMIKKIAGQLRSIIDEAQAGLEYCAAYQRPYLADYVFRMALGGYFVNHRPSQGIDCIRILY